MSTVLRPALYQTSGDLISFCVSRQGGLSASCQTHYAIQPADLCGRCGSSYCWLVSTPLFICSEYLCVFCDEQARLPTHERIRLLYTSGKRGQNNSTGGVQPILGSRTPTRVGISMLTRPHLSGTSKAPAGRRTGKVRYTLQSPCRSI